MPVKKHPFHSMCSYLGCFPPAVPRRIIDQWTRPGDVVLDPFCGSGTSLVEAVLLGRKAVGVDMNPLAVAISRAKAQPIALGDVLYRVQDLAAQYRGAEDLSSVPEDISIIFHARTLSQLEYLRRTLDPESAEDAFLIGALLGIMHGKFRKGGGSAYLSIDMPNTFSMSPEYVRKFVRKNGLRQVPVDAFGKLAERSRWLMREGALSNAGASIVLQGDATDLRALLRKAGAGRVDAIVTSPPYLGVLRYGAFNWIRLWFLGFKPASVDRTLDSTDSLERYLSFMISFLMSAGEVLKPKSVVGMVIGDVVEEGLHLPLAERIWEEIEGLVPFGLKKIEMDNFDASSKTTRIWGEEKKGRATPRDRIMVLERSPTEKVVRKVRTIRSRTSDLDGH
jgi:hypothetical protein